MKIVFFTRRELANPMSGGSEVLVDRLAGGAAAHGHDVSLIAAGPVGERSYAVRDGGGPYSQYLRAPFTHLRHFRDADLVVDVANGLSFFVPLWRRSPAICLINHLHTDQWEQWFPAPLAALGRRLETVAMPAVYRDRLFIAVSASTARSLQELGVDGDRIRIVPNGIDVTTNALGRSEGPLFLCLGRLVPHKRVELVLQAWEQVRPRVGGRLVIAGDGPQRERLVAMAGQAVTFTGQVTEAEKRRLLAQAWLLLHPAQVEGWGLVVMEAAASATPTIAFDVPGLRDSVVDGSTGLLARSFEEFVGHWVTLAEHPTTRAQFGLQARTRAAGFRWSSSVDGFLRVVEEATTRRRCPRRAPASGIERRWT